MTHPTHIICLGCCCSASFRLQECNLKQESSFVEWMISVDFKDILYLLKQITTNKIDKVRVVPIDRFQFKFENTDIKTRHYKTPKDIEERFQRRAHRFRNWIESNNQLIFIRHESNSPTTKSDLQQFDQLLRQINPQITYKFHLFTPPSLYKIENRITLPHINHAPLPKDNSTYCKIINS